ncbi:class I poly(R)-hydroxyalkanoic acid synthase [Usitatibacter palustris]|uniref:Poly(3-hydroxyalkanoate) polymerase subunit PhaC n=1 Tax=Usitatibacter palustris TaxID=2732487 RepID=A0A6M4H7B2_9PROT|nr:class I poly(R)-hydroxyalkanoic acid synthase [Usitatibacter palustris]QJR15486.1 Poly(3-hydroxyalkanoate) polymerase subunit PhaC [Usitatibacter palustris]
MARRTPPTVDPEQLGDLIRQSQEKMAQPPLPEQSTTQQVMAGFAGAYKAWLDALSAHPDKMVDLQSRYMQEQMNLWANAMQGSKAEGAAETDKRFTAPEWSELPVFRYFRDSYLAASKTLMQAVETAELDAATKQRMRFFMRQYLDAAAPSNYLLTNPEALRAAIDSRGETLQEGMKNLLADLEKGRISMTDEKAFEVGKNVGVSTGAVVFENELMQLIQYTPLTPKVHELPLVMVPPCINKFYIMDLQPANSLVRYAVEQGHTVFMVSWRNVKQAQDKLTWDDYVEKGVIAALEEARRICGTKEVNALGFCIGGTLVGCALAVLEKKGKNFVPCVTLLTTLLDFTEVGEIRVYIDKNFVEKREKQLKEGGLVAGNELAGAFSSLRANDLVWNYVVNNYLKGKAPPAFDLLFWNSDATNLPGPMYAYYLRNTYQDNKLAKPDALKMCGVPVSLKRVKIPAFVFAAREDHIVPWKGGYASARTLGGPVTFVLGASGHIAGTINPPVHKKRSHWVGSSKLDADPQKWLDKAKEVPGSWWTPWTKWLKPQAGKLVPARTKLGGGKRKPIEPAPGRYVKERAET